MQFLLIRSALDFYIDRVSFSLCEIPQIAFDSDYHYWAIRKNSFFHQLDEELLNIPSMM